MVSDFRLVRGPLSMTPAMLSLLRPTGRPCTVRRAGTTWTCSLRLYNASGLRTHVFLFQYHSYTNYQASLAHKLNHSFTPNCTWATADHPCFGFVPSVVAIEEVKAGEELTIHYMMDMADAPEWYMDCWDTHSK